MARYLEDIDAAMCPLIQWQQSEWSNIDRVSPGLVSCEQGFEVELATHGLYHIDYRTPKWNVLIEYAMPVVAYLGLISPHGMAAQFASAPYSTETRHFSNLLGAHRANSKCYM